MTDAIALDKIKNVIVDCMNTAVKVFPTLKEIDQPTITVDLSGTCGGEYVHAAYGYSKDHSIRINKVLMNENEETILGQTVPHEVAHMIVIFLYGCERNWRTGRRKVAPHGKEWKMVMGVLGKKASRCHNMDTSNSARNTRNIRRWEYKCGCGEPHEITTIRHNKMRRGEYTLSCKKCRTTLVFTGRQTNTSRTVMVPVAPKDNKVHAKGNAVVFEATKGRTLTGVIVRVNKKSLTIDAGVDGKWRVHPSFVK